MKRRFFIVLVALSVCLLGGCESAPDVASLSSADFGKEARMLLDALGDDVAFFDYTVGKEAHSFTIGVWFCENGEWTNRGEIIGDVNKTGKGRFGVRTTASNCELFLLDDDGYTRYAVNEGIDFSAVTSTGSMQLNGMEVPLFDEETVLLVKRGSNASEFRTFDLQEFREIDAERGVAFTITFHR